MEEFFPAMDNCVFSSRGTQRRGFRYCVGEGGSAKKRKRRQQKALGFTTKGCYKIEELN